IDSKQPIDLAPLSEIRHPPVASVVLGFRREDVAHPCEGFGMLIPKVEGFKILGTIFSSSLFPNRAPAGARFGNNDEEKIVPRILNPSTLGINIPKPSQGCATSSRRKPSTTLATGG